MESKNKIKKPRPQKKPKEPKPPKPILTEAELAYRQAEKMQKDMKRVQATNMKSVDQKENIEGVDIWKDSDFYFCVVFQSARQKYTFLEELSKKINLGIDQCRSSDEMIQIINGLEFAKKLGIILQSEKSPNYPYPNLELSKLTLDDQSY